MGLLFLLALNSATLVLYLRPLGRSLHEQQSELERVKARRQEAQRSVEQMRELRGKLQTALQEGHRFAQEHFQMRRAGFSAILADLEQQAVQSRLKPGGAAYQLREEKDRPGWANVEVTLVVEGEYPDLVRLINRLEQSDMFWIINGLNVTGGQAQGKGLRMSLDMETYFLSS